ncbi:MFS transporter [Solimicrobium silvestre]|uniref:Arabinose efflux permease n=1 Tax=Solimicrobium silvestre TaxID=2099400 RepID=A0A2S9GZG4_9BURK|nr:MFS transporter [Solimicrobium silvestre]PRC93125.1 Arabinose efflux permease [Solimicrobium silvestre]
MNHSPPHLNQPPGQSDWRIWLSIVFLGIGAFTIVTTELAPIGLLSAIAQDIGRSESAIGLTVTLYAWIGAFSALLAAIALGRIPRKPLLIGLMLCLALSNGAAMTADGFGLLLAARACGAVAHGLFWAVIAASAAQIAPPRHVGLAMSIVFGGVSAASVLGVPLATLIGQESNWRIAFGAVGALSLLTALGMLAVLPRLEQNQVKDTRAALGSVLRRMDLCSIYVATAFAVTAHFAAFTFIEPFLREAPGMQATMVIALLFGFGTSGLAANFLTGIFIDRYLRALLLLALALMTLSLFALGIWGTQISVAGVGAMLILWGASISTIFVGFQTWILRTAGAAAMPASAVYVAIFNAAIGSGAMIGAWVQSHSGFAAVMMVGGLGGAASILVVTALGSHTSIPQSELQP